MADTRDQRWSQADDDLFELGPDRADQILALVRTYFDSENTPQEARNDAEAQLKAMLK